MSTHDVDLLMGTKQDSSEYRPELDFCKKEVWSVNGPATGYSSSEDQVPFKPAAGQCRTSGMCTWRRKKKCLNNWRREGSLRFSFCTPSPGSNRLKPSWQWHLVLWIPHKRADYGQRRTGMVEYFHDMILDTQKNFKKNDLIWIKMRFHVSFPLLFTFWISFRLQLYVRHVEKIYVSVDIRTATNYLKLFN